MLTDTKLEDFKLRFAEQKDVSLILEFLKELVDYEKMLNEVVATEEILTESLFERKRLRLLLVNKLYLLEDKRKRRQIMFVNFVVHTIISLAVFSIAIFNLEKMKIFTRSRLLLIIILIVLFFIRIFAKASFEVGSLIRTIILGVATPISIMVLFYLIVSKKKVNNQQ